MDHVGVLVVQVSQPSPVGCLRAEDRGGDRLRGWYDQSGSGQAEDRHLLLCFLVCRCQLQLSE